MPGATPFITNQIATNQIEENGVNTNAFGISGFCEPAESGWLPSISAGYGVNGSSGSDLRTSQSWMVGLQCIYFLAGVNRFGMGVGQPAFATSTRNGAASESGVWAWGGIQWQVTDAISATPTVFYINNPGALLEGPISLKL